MPYYLIFPDFKSDADLFIPSTGIARIQVYKNENRVELFLSNGDRANVTKDEFKNAIKPLIGTTAGINAEDMLQRLF